MSRSGHFPVFRETVSKASVFKDSFSIGVVGAVRLLAIAETQFAERGCDYARS